MQMQVTWSDYDAVSLVAILLYKEFNNLLQRKRAGLRQPLDSLTRRVARAFVVNSTFAYRSTINKASFGQDFASTLLNERVALAMQKQPGFDWNKPRCHFTASECLQIVNNTLLSMYEASIVFRGKMQTLRANMAERSGKVYIWKCKINYVQAALIVQGKKSHLAISM